MATRSPYAFLVKEFEQIFDFLPESLILKVLLLIIFFVAFRQEIDVRIGIVFLVNYRLDKDSGKEGWYKGNKLVLN